MTYACALVGEGKFCFFFLWWSGLYEVVILFAGDWACVFVLFVVWMSRPVLHSAGSWVLPVLVYRWRPLWEFLLINTPWVRNFLVV